MKQFWNERYAEKEFVYGKEPNQFLKENLHQLPTGKILFVAEGEGRNAVFAAQNGCIVFAFDYSESAKNKAIMLAKEQNVELDYLVSDVMELPFEPESFDAIVFIFAHFPSEIRKQAHQKLVSFLKPNGKILFEAFEKNQLQFTSGGPKEPAMLFSEDEVKDEFSSINFNFLETAIITLEEGPFHQGQGAVIRFIGTKHEKNE
ncbi:MAG: class I SAM-dependent methyltransferase [Flavobacterium sp.]|nr:class I SAM-dependent methyltransferase [Flavobacterium sp.]